MLGNPSNVIYRPDRIVRLGGTGSVVGTAAKTINLNGDGTAAADLRVDLDFNPAAIAAILSAVQNDELGLHFAYTCGNDVLDGAFVATPEPDSILLLATVLGAAGLFTWKRARLGGRHP